LAPLPLWKIAAATIPQKKSPTTHHQAAIASELGRYETRVATINKVFALQISNRQTGIATFDLPPTMRIIIIH
jgi:hypothetical protein